MKENNIRHKTGFCKNCNAKIFPNKYGYCRKCYQNNKNKTKIKEWLSTGYTGTSVQSTLRNSIRAYILEKQNNCCKICGIKNIWNNIHLNFILDHIDGDASNNYDYNLRLICPNCDSQLDTYKSKNKNSARSDKTDKRSKKVTKLDIVSNNVIDEYDSISDAATKNNCSHVTISKCLNGKQKTAIGYKWRFK